MAYSCSVHFSDQNSYITLFISSYILEDMIFARFKPSLPFSGKQKRVWDVSHRRGRQPGSLTRVTREADEAADWAAGGPEPAGGFQKKNRT
jgi:hypothetical protein